MGTWGQSWQSLDVDIVNWSLVLSSELKSVLVLCDGEEDGMVTVDVLTEGDAGSGCVCDLQLLFVGSHLLPQGM